MTTEGERLDLLEGYTSALQRFSAIHDEMCRNLERIKQRDDIRTVKLALEASASGARIVAFAHVLSEAHAAAAAAQAEWTSAPTGEQEPFPTREFDALGNTWARLDSCYQAMFFFVRGYQDPLYRVLLRLAGEKWGAGSMSDAFEYSAIDDPDSPPGWTRRKKLARYKTRNPAARTLATEVPDYPRWFVRWRELRNGLKSGAATNGFATPGDIGIVFSEISPKGHTMGDTRQVITLSTVAEGLSMSAAVALVVSTAVAQFQTGVLPSA